MEELREAKLVQPSSQSTTAGRGVEVDRLDWRVRERQCHFRRSRHDARRQWGNEEANRRDNGGLPAQRAPPRGHRPNACWQLTVRDASPALSLSEADMWAARAAGEPLSLPSRGKEEGGGRVIRGVVPMRRCGPAAFDRYFAESGFGPLAMLHIGVYFIGWRWRNYSLTPTLFVFSRRVPAPGAAPRRAGAHGEDAAAHGKDAADPSLSPTKASASPMPSAPCICDSRQRPQHQMTYPFANARADACM